MAPKLLCAAVVLGTVVGFSTVLGAAPARACAKDFDVQATDSCGNILSVSVLGNAQGGDCTQLVTCLTFGTQSATNTGGPEPCKIGCIAVSPTGDASNNMGSQSCGATTGVQIEVTVGCMAVASGDANNNAGLCGTGSGANLTVGCIAVSVTGTSSNTASRCGYNSMGSTNPVLRIAAGCVAASVFGQATNNVPECGVVDATLGLAAGVGCVAVGGANASNSSSTCGLGYAGTAGLAIAAGCLAVAGVGTADNAAGICGWFWAVGTFGMAIGCVAASLVGPSAGNTSTWCGYAEASLAAAVAIGCVALAPFGTTTHPGPDASCGDSFGIVVVIACVP